MLDIDGTLVDSNDAHARAWVDTLAQFGHDVPFARVRSLIGEGDRSKPDPDIIQAALVKANATPSAADALATWRCATGTGTQRLDGAIAIYEDAADLLARCADSALGRRRT